MAEAVAAELAVEAAKAMTKLVTARASDEMTLVWGLEDQFIKLQNRFSDIQALLEDLGSSKHLEIRKSKFVNCWLQKLIDAVYSADELMDDYAYELLRRKIELKVNHPSFKKKCSNFFSPSTNPVIFRFRMGHRVREILYKFDELDKEAINNGLQKVQLAREAVSSSTVGYFVDNSMLHQNRKHAAARGLEFIGRKSDEEKLLQMILNRTGEDVDLSTLAIVGIGGLGKTTIARRLYDHEEVDGHFEKQKVWICASEDFKVDRLLNEMVEHLTSDKCDLTNTGAITNKLQQKLKGKKFLLVLDDVWENNQESWDSFKNALLSIGALRGSMILITTRSIDVARKARAFYQHKLPGLSEDEGWALLQQRVFSETFPYDSSLKDVGRRIVNRCKGVPLAIKAISGLLQSKKHAYEWESIHKNELWGFRPEDINDILPSLLLSYNHLNHVYIKQCFAYCAIFPKDFIMERRQLITLWLAQGFLHDGSASNNFTSTMETIGEKYFDTLLNHSFLEEERVYNKIGYKMHDLVHDLAAYVLEKNLLIWKVGIKLGDVSCLRHLVFDSGMSKTASETSTLTSVMTGKLRTISFWSSVPRWNNFTIGGARYLRVLIMAGTRLRKVPYMIGQLVHLRYLDLSNNNIKVLPESICKLYQLQTLRVLDCDKMRKLPGELHRLKNLRHIEVTSTLLACRGLRQLSNLQTLPPLELRDGKGWTIDELGPLDQVMGEIKILGLENVKNNEAARQAGLGKKDKIVTLHLEWGVNREATSRVDSDEAILYGFEPHPNLQSLNVGEFMGVSFPSWIMTMVNLTKVELRECNRCVQLPTLGQLPFLRILSLQVFEAVESIGDEFYQSGSSNNYNAEEKVLFRSLSELYIFNFERLTKWMPSSFVQAATAFPNLKILEIRCCRQLKTVPAFHFKSLHHLELENVGGPQLLDIIKFSQGLGSLDVAGFCIMMILPHEMLNCTNLERLKISECTNMKSIPSGLISLKKLNIVSCPSLACIPDDLSSLHRLYVRDCKRLEKMPKSLEECTSLEFLSINDCPLIKGSIVDLSRLQGLEDLTLVNAGELMTLSLTNLCRLKNLRFGGFVDSWDFNLTYPQSLRSLGLADFPTVKTLPQHPLQQLLPSNLQSLLIMRFDELEELPEWIGSLSSLEKLELWHCKKLKYLPSKQVMLRLSRLRRLSIYFCPLLKERCAEVDGPEWLNISHIPCIDIY